MRVIGGEFRSRRLKSVPGLATRPTPDRLRETLFNILAPRIGGAVFVDAYAGTGAVGIEALSRGAARCVFVENGRRAVEAIRENLHLLGIEGRGSVVAGKVVAAMGWLEAPDILFLDPPYEMEGEYGAALGVANILRDKEILEAARREALDFVSHPPSEEELRRAVAYIRDHWQRRYGLVTVG